MMHVSLRIFAVIPTLVDYPSGTIKSLLRQTLKFLFLLRRIFGGGNVSKI